MCSGFHAQVIFNVFCSSVRICRTCVCVCFFSVWELAIIEDLEIKTYPCEVLQHLPHSHAQKHTETLSKSHRQEAKIKVHFFSGLYLWITGFVFSLLSPGPFFFLSVFFKCVFVHKSMSINQPAAKWQGIRGEGWYESRSQRHFFFKLTGLFFPVKATFNYISQHLFARLTSGHSMFKKSEFWLFKIVKYQSCIWFLGPHESALLQN